METPEVGETYTVVIEEEFENPWIGKNGGARIGVVDVAVPHAKIGESYEVRVLSVGRNPWTKRLQAKVDVVSGGARAAPEPYAARFDDAVDFFDPATWERFGPGFVRAGDHYALVKRRPARELLATEQQLVGPSGIQRFGIPERGGALRSMRFVHAGTPHRVVGMHGYWHVNARDEISLVLLDPGATEGLVCLLERRPLAGEREAMAWYCLRCSTELHRVEYDSLQTGEHDAGSLFDHEQETRLVEEFNASSSLRSCKRCGAEHPRAYRSFAPDDTPEETAARAVW